MLIKTHYTIALFFILLLVPYTFDKTIFIAVALFATFIPDIDSRFSKLGKKKIVRVLLFFTKHRGIIHSFTFLILITFLIYSIFPVAALPFFVGYGVHLLADSFTIRGIRLFYPLKITLKGGVRTGGKKEKIIFFLFIILDVFMFFVRIIQ